jgi:hypothetical protein
MDFHFLIPYIHYLVLLIIALLVLYVKSFVSEKAKSKALKGYNHEIELLKSQYQKELEEIKKDHQLDISKRKYQYESKKEQYLKFYRVIDDFSANYYLTMQENFLPIIEEFNKNFLNASYKNNKREETNATVVFSKKTQKLMFDSNQEMIRIKQETNTIRLIASDSILRTLDLMEYAYDKIFDTSSKFIKEMPALIMSGKADKLKENQNELELMGNVILDIKKDMIKQMREELNEI